MGRFFAFDSQNNKTFKPVSYYRISGRDFVAFKPLNAVHHWPTYVEAQEYNSTHISGNTRYKHTNVLHNARLNTLIIRKLTGKWGNCTMEWIYCCWETHTRQTYCFLHINDVLVFRNPKQLFADCISKSPWLISICSVSRALIRSIIHK